MAEPIAIVSVREATVRFGWQTVLDRVSLTINEGERLGLVGRNGSGKSILLGIIAGQAGPDTGEVIRRRGLVTGYMPQQFALAETEDVASNVRSGAQRILDLLAAYEHAAPESAESVQLLEQLQRLDAWGLERRIKEILQYLHAPPGDALVRDLSGGEKRRVALCRALVCQPDFLILDEPTNHLDTEAIEWLQKFLAGYPGTCLFVTHDRYFLDQVATGIAELAAGTCLRYEGNYTDYLLARAERRTVAEQQERKRQKFLDRELAWIRRGPSARRTKSVDRIDRYFELAQQQGPEAESEVELILPPAPKLSDRVVELRGLGLKLNERWLFQQVNFELRPGERVGIIGRNGLGKSSLLKIILGELAPTVGEVQLGPQTKINHVDQNRLIISEEKTVSEEVGGGSEIVRLGDQSISLRAYLRRFLFPEERINTKIGLLSGGERNRVILAKILKQGGNVLMLDEPTNDLDLGTLRLLEEALIAFSGSVLVVSHDRYFLNRVATGILAFEGNGVVRYQVGNYDYYLEKRPVSTPETDSKTRSTNRDRSVPDRPVKLTWKEARELEQMENQINHAELAVKNLEDLFSAPDFYVAHGKDWAKLEAQLTSARERVTELYSRWAELEKKARDAAGE